GNLALGANAQPVPPTGPVVSAALSAAKAVGAGFAGIDILVTSEGPVVIEVNVCPQFQGFVQATGIDVADRVLSHLLALPAPEVKPLTVLLLSAESRPCPGLDGMISAIESQGHC